MSTIGFLHSGSRDSFQDAWKAFKANVPGDVEIKDRYANDDPGVLKKMASDLVNDRAIKAIVAAGGPQTAKLLRDMTKTIPIVFTTVADPVGSELVATLQRPGRNLTGMAGQTSELDPERLQRLIEFAHVKIKKGDRIGVLIRHGRPVLMPKFFRNLKRKAGDEKLKAHLVEIEVETVGGIAQAFDMFEREGVKGVLVTADSFFNSNRKMLVELAAAKKLPAIYQWKEFVREGGLISYGPSLLEAYEMAGKYVTEILGGKSPRSMPCSKPSRFELCVSREAAQKLGLDVPERLFGDPVQLM